MARFSPPPPPRRSPARRSLRRCSAAVQCYCWSKEQRARPEGLKPFPFLFDLLAPRVPVLPCPHL
jgi:hypothetical protein